jgi:hypothetical protein
LLLASALGATDTCEDAASGREVNAALAEIEASIDPCSESAELTNLVREFRRCAGDGYRVCRDPRSERNFIQPGERKKGIPTTITWNPELETELERGCGGHANRPVLRDPIASLLHEVVHAVQDCQGLNPSEHELEAVRIENIYRRARGLCQRTRYGDELLPAGMTVACAPGNCYCTPADTRLETAAYDQNGRATTVFDSEVAGDLASPSTRLGAER